MRLHSLATAAVLLIAASVSQAQTIYGVTDGDVPDVVSSLVLFSPSNPNIVTNVAPISGLVAGQTLRGIDFRPSDGQLYALSNAGTTGTSQLYTINLATAAATPVGGGLALTGNSSGRISLDFDPVSGALRVVTGSGQNYRVNATTGTLIAQDTSITSSALVAGIAYTNNVVGATQTTLYAYEFFSDTLNTVGSVNGTPNSPDGGALGLVGPTGTNAFNAAVGFDIDGADGTAYVVLDEDGSRFANSELFRVDLTTGFSTQISATDGLPPLLDISVAPIPEPGCVLLCGSLAAGVGAYVRRRLAAA